MANAHSLLEKSKALFVESSTNICATTAHLGQCVWRSEVIHWKYEKQTYHREMTRLTQKMSWNNQHWKEESKHANVNVPLSFISFQRALPGLPVVSWMKASFTAASLEASGADRAVVRLLWYEYLAQYVGKLQGTVSSHTQIYWLTSEKLIDGKNACDLSWWNSCLEGVLTNESSWRYQHWIDIPSGLISASILHTSNVWTEKRLVYAHWYCIATYRQLGCTAADPRQRQWLPPEDVTLQVGRILLDHTVMTQWKHLRGLTGSVLFFCLYSWQELWATVVSKTNENTTQRSAVETCVACSFMFKYLGYLHPNLRWLDFAALNSTSSHSLNSFACKGKTCAMFLCHYKVDSSDESRMSSWWLLLLESLS